MNESTLFVDIGCSPAIRSLRRQTTLYKESKEVKLEKVKKFLVEIVAVSKDYFEEFKPEDPNSNDQVSVRFSGKIGFAWYAKKKELTLRPSGTHHNTTLWVDEKPQEDEILKNIEGLRYTLEERVKGIKIVVY